MIGFNKPHITGKEFEYVQQAIKVEKLSGNGYFTHQCQEFFEKRYGFKKALLTHSCTGALEMASLLLNIQPGDEVIIPSYTFVSTANAFLLHGATIVFADSNPLNPNVDANHIRRLITKKTRVIVVVHYAGIACDMDAIMEIATTHKLFVVEDAAQAIDSYYKGKPLGSIGHLAAFSFHETKNLTSGGEGGMLVVNDDRFIERSEIIWEKGTNRSAFFRGEVDKYTWVDKGSSFLPSELTAAFLFAQLECLDDIQQKRKTKWQQYYSYFLANKLGGLQLPYIDQFASNNAHLFFLVTTSLQQRNQLLAHLKSHKIQAIFHYLPLHNSPYYKSVNPANINLLNASRFGERLVRLPLYTDISSSDVQEVSECVASFYRL